MANRVEVMEFISEEIGIPAEILPNYYQNEAREYKNLIGACVTKFQQAIYLGEVGKSFTISNLIEALAPDE